MVIVVEVVLSLMRIFLLFAGLAFSVTLGNALYSQINLFLYSFGLPCLELISFLVLFVPPIALYFGVIHKKYFWQRQNHYNVIVFVTSFVLGTLFTLLPLGYTPSWAFSPQCMSHPDVLSQIVEVIGTGLVTALFAYLGMDLGVLLKHLSHKLQAKKKRKS